MVAEARLTEAVPGRFRNVMQGIRLSGWTTSVNIKLMGKIMELRQNMYLDRSMVDIDWICDILNGILTVAHWRQ